MVELHEATCSAPVNIAVVKYWGKRQPLQLILPTNSSLSVTLSQDHLKSTTTIRADPLFEKDRLWLNGKEEKDIDTGRMGQCIKEMRALRKELEARAESKVNGHLTPLSELPLHIVSVNNFPTAAGLASSASGFAALVTTLAALYQLNTSPSDLSRIARQGSGSACRSMFGGFVAWQMGQSDEGQDSLAIEIAPQQHWPEIHALICVVSDAKKGTPSTAGMQRTVESSSLLQHRIKNVVPQRMEIMSQAIKAKDFNTFAEHTMKDSNQFHACCLDTDPPIFYMNDVSRAIIALIVELNQTSLSAGQGYKAAYTYDAGPNAVIYAPAVQMPEIIELIHHYFPLPSGSTFKDPFQLYPSSNHRPNPPRQIDNFNTKVIPIFPPGSVKELIHTCVGDGPRRLPDSESLIDSKGFPKFLS